MTGRFFAAADGGDRNTLMALLAPEGDADGRVAVVLNTANPDKLSSVQAGTVRIR
ncbi:hypothetical protein ACWT_2175 [Actinoplanes sp. SE50]|uniref:hypothetical protein n=1 Tax=unclassified Actinoplanes TaxID=2626549 RepID=UPI00023ECC5D|nr:MULTISPECIES: hypothetical protein [unclassified Actinoplanes]AEV83195.1 hypothetical protein ACPL_2300 [Actinoplanes sp. SE50/110]ATO81590.1 hypothetical protein ACWT_2175 [Actinoplanes sp. SE50]SLL98998.1 uncharacterized protein ACSP50_2226 [Actinoplanes sp. SE50/110]